MRYAIISDIHGNLEALERVLTDIANEKVEKVLCLGDVVGYGPNPNECVELVKDQVDLILAGNHDYAAVGKTDISYFNYHAQGALQWTAQVLSSFSISFLRDLPLIMRRDNFLLVHATPEDPVSWDYILTRADAVRNFSFFDDPACFIGHSHVPVVLVEIEPGDCWAQTAEQLTFKEDERYIINVGSVGQPRDHDPRAAYGILDSEKQTFQLKRIEYDILTTQKKMRKAGLPEFLIERLSIGQ